MSINSFAMLRGLRASGLSASARSMGVAIIVRSGDGRPTWASVKTLGEDAGLCERTARTALEALVAAGLVVCTTRPGHTSLHVMNTDRMMTLAAQDSSRAAARACTWGPDQKHVCTTPTTPATIAAHPGNHFRTPRQLLPHTPALVADEIPKEMHTEIPSRPTREAGAAAAALLVGFGMSPRKAKTIARTMSATEVETAIYWCSVKNKGAGFIGWAVKEGDKPWLAGPASPTTNPVDAQRAATAATIQEAMEALNAGEAP